LLPSKALSPIYIIPSGKVIFVRDVPSKALAPIKKSPLDVIPLPVVDQVESS